MADSWSAAGPARSTTTVAVTVTEVADDAAARAAVDDGEADAWLHPGRRGWVLIGRDDVPERPAATSPMTVVRDATLDRERGRRPAPRSRRSRGVPRSTTAGPRAVTPTSADFAQGIGVRPRASSSTWPRCFRHDHSRAASSRRSSRGIVEIIATTIPVRQLLAGKVLGNTGLAVGQMVALRGDRARRARFDLVRRAACPPSPAPLAWFLVFFVVGFLALACLWAVAGSLASRGPRRPPVARRPRSRSSAPGHLLRVDVPRRHARRWCSRSSRRSPPCSMPHAVLEGGPASGGSRSSPSRILARGGGRGGRSWPSGSTGARCCQTGRAGSSTAAGRWSAPASDQVGGAGRVRGLGSPRSVRLTAATGL